MAHGSWGAHPDRALIVYKGLLRSVLEYGCITFDRAADCHMLKHERIQYRCLRTALGLMQSTHVQAVEVIAAVELLKIRFSMLNQKYGTNAVAKPTHHLVSK
jgi:hypothetical protein